MSISLDALLAILAMAAATVACRLAGCWLNPLSVPVPYS